LLALLALLWLGGISIWGFALTLTFGVFVGTYSSIFVSSPVLLEMTGEKLGRAKK
jgi:preprotein translocase subunit SecF